MSNPTRIGVFGGTFDPIHVGHLVVAANAAHQLGLDVVLFVVAHVPWQKVDERTISSSADRLTMVELAVAGHARLVASSLEIDRGGDSLTADTLEQLAAEEPDAELFLILGSDAAAGLDTWKRTETIKALASPVVIDRPGARGETVPAGWRAQHIECPLVDLSSTDLRIRAATGLPIDFLVPSAVQSYIVDHGLYAP